MNGFIYLFGGKNKNGLLSDMWMFDIEQETWSLISQLQDIPTPRKSFAYGSFGNTFIVFGGEDSSGLLDDLYIFNSLTNTWQFLAPISYNIPSPRKGACAVFKLPSIFIYGGETINEISNELWLFDIGNSQYRLISKSIERIAYATCQLILDEFQIYFGENGKQSPVSGIYKYNFTEGIWIPFKKITNNGFTQGIAVNINDKIIYYGGRNLFNSYNSLNLFSNGENFNINTNLHPYDMAYVIYGTKLYISGGGSINLYGTLTPLIYNPIFVYIDLNASFSSFGIRIECSPGTTFDKNSCTQCPPGTYSEDYGNSECIKCPIGTYNSMKGANRKKQCLPCPQNSFNNIEGSINCLQCLAGEYCPIGSTSPSLWIKLPSVSSIQPINLITRKYDPAIEQFVIYSMIILISLLILAGISKLRNCFINYDIFTQAHNYKCGAPMVLKKTTFGGFFTIVFISYAVVLIISTCLYYFLDNVTEIKTFQPVAVLEYEIINFYTSIEVNISLIQCPASCGSNNKCNKKIIIETIGITQNTINSEIIITCTKDIHESCNIKYFCINCYIETGASIVVTVNEDFTYASGIYVSVSSNSSIPESNSFIQTGILASENMVYSGSTASRVYFSMIPSYFKSNLNEYPQSATGYHVALGWSTFEGSQNFIEDLGKVNNLIVNIQLTKTISGLHTTRYASQTIFPIIAALLGSVAGAMGAIRFLMSFSEKHYLKWANNHKKNKTLAELLESNISLKENLGNFSLKKQKKLIRKMNSGKNLLVKV